MIRRRSAPWLVLGALGLAAATWTPAAAPATSSSYYVVRPDARLCPSPRCGGYWVSLVNRPRTRCHDGVLRSRCYVALAFGPGAPFALGDLARGRIKPKEFGSTGTLGILAVEASYVPTGRAVAMGVVTRIVDTGIRCIRAPCFSFRSTPVNTFSWTKLSEVDVRSARVSETHAQRAEAALGDGGLIARGVIVLHADGGRTFRATRLFLDPRR